MDWAELIIKISYLKDNLETIVYMDMVEQYIKMGDIILVSGKKIVVMEKEKQFDMTNI
jgi:hypothetical protein